jgi:hypothetical protein
MAKINFHYQKLQAGCLFVGRELVQEIDFIFPPEGAVPSRSNFIMTSASIAGSLATPYRVLSPERVSFTHGHGPCEFRGVT